MGRGWGNEYRVKVGQRLVGISSGNKSFEMKLGTRSPGTRYLLSLEFRSFREPQAALGERLAEQFFDHALFAVLSHGQLADQEIASPLQHLLLAERKRLGCVQK